MPTLKLVALAALCLAGSACSKDGGSSAEAPASAPADAPAAASAPIDAQKADAEKAAALAALPAPYNTGDLSNGQSKFAFCRSCHTITEGGPDMTGPNLHGVFGRKAGSKAGYKYSDAVKAAGFTWDAEHLDKWLSSPRDFLPGTKMTFAGLHDPKDRIDLIAYLKVESGYKPGAIAVRPASPELEARVQRLYDANQRRDYEAFRALVGDQLEWPDLTRGGWLTTPEAVRDYWAYNDGSLRIEITPVEIRVLDDGRVLVDANQVIWNRSGQQWSDGCVRHCYTLRDGLFWRMDVVSEGDADPGP